uniref:Uncharacterized protein n=1 Tax=Vitrella brassicaformis TaxID=1169539 RepID=A0A7S1PDX6_9ALVE|mmetsp:Transcript_7654/g.18749  ORF Transcript_7654/g.18749 Transcript_7654/m.18749 type:complete len:349 (+) Transcript_7654:136-1182(+)
MSSVANQSTEASSALTSAQLDTYPWVLRISTSKHGKDVSDDSFAKLLCLLDNITTARKVFSSKKVKAEGLRFEAVPYFNSEMAFSGKLSGLEVYVGSFEKSSGIMEEHRLDKLKALLEGKRTDLAIADDVQLTYEKLLYPTTDERKRVPVGVYLPCRYKYDSDTHPADFRNSVYCLYPYDLQPVTPIAAPAFTKPRAKPKRKPKQQQQQADSKTDDSSGENMLPPRVRRRIKDGLAQQQQQAAAADQSNNALQDLENYVDNNINPVNRRVGGRRGAAAAAAGGGGVAAAAVRRASQAPSSRPLTRQQRKRKEEEMNQNNHLGNNHELLLQGGTELQQLLLLQRSIHPH